MRALTLLFALIMLCAVPVGHAAAPAPAFNAQSGSTLTFEGSYGGEPFQGRFLRFRPSVQFSPTNLPGSRIDVEITTASSRTDSLERDDLMHSQDFFMVSRFPKARFVATDIRADGPNKFVARGTLTIRDISAPVALSFSWTPGPQPVLVGEARVRRLTFKMGALDFPATTDLGADVIVRTKLILTPRTP